MVFRVQKMESRDFSKAWFRKSLVGEVPSDAERKLGAGFGLNTWSGSMVWAARGDLGLEAMLTHTR